ELTLAELLAERVAAQARARAWRAQRAAQEALDNSLDALENVGRRGVAALTALLDGDTTAAEALDLLVDDPARFFDREPDLAGREDRALPWLARRRTSLDQLAAAHDARWLLVCDVCGMAAPRHDPDRGVWDGAAEDAGCPHCYAGHLIDPADAAVPTLAERLADLRARLRRRPWPQGRFPPRGRPRGTGRLADAAGELTGADRGGEAGSVLGSAPGS